MPYIVSKIDYTKAKAPVLDSFITEGPSNDENGLDAIARAYDMWWPFVPSYSRQAHKMQEGYFTASLFNGQHSIEAKAWGVDYA